MAGMGRCWTGFARTRPWRAADRSESRDLRLARKMHGMAGVTDPTSERDQMVRTQIAARGIHDPAVLAAFRGVPREAFLPPELREFAYQDSPLPIEQGQTISQPFIVALMTAALELGPEDSVLEIGTGSGYAAAILGRIARRVYTVERHQELAELAAHRLEQLGLRNVTVRHGDGSLGWPEHAPYDAIVVAAGAPSVPQALLRSAGSRRASGAAGRRGPRTPEARARDAPERRELCDRGSGRRSLRAADRRPGLAGGGLGRARGQAPEPSGERGASDPRAGAAVRRDRGARPGRAARAHRRLAAGADRRGEPRHLRVLPDARRDHEGALPLARLRPGGGRGGLARRRRAEPVGPGSAPGPGRHRPDAPLPALPDLDVAQPRDARVRRVAARPQRQDARRPPADRLLRSRPLQPVQLDPGGAPVPRPRRSDRGTGGSPALCVPDALGGRPRRLRTRGDQRPLSGLRTRGRRDVARPDRAAPRLRRARRRGGSRRGAERAPDRGRRALLPRDVLRLERVLEPSRPAHVRHARVAARVPRSAREGRGLGAQLAPRRRLGDRDGAARVSSTSGSSAARSTRDRRS